MFKAFFYFYLPKRKRKRKREVNVSYCDNNNNSDLSNGTILYYPKKGVGVEKEGGGESLGKKN